MIKDWHWDIFIDFQENLKKSKHIAFDPSEYTRYSADGVDVEYVLLKLSLLIENNIRTTTPDIRLKT